MASEREKFAGRLNETLDERGFPRLGQGRQSELAKVLGAPPQQVGKWLKGQDFPRTSQLVKLARHLGVRSNWLLAGAGPKYPEERQEGGGANGDGAVSGVAEERPAAQTVLSHEGFDLALMWMRLPPAQRETVRALIRSMLPGH